MSQPNQAAVVASVRSLSGVPAGGAGPDDARIFEAVEAFVEAFDFWYIRVMREAVPEYRKLIVMRINPFVRRIECDEMDATQTATGWSRTTIAATSSPPEVGRSRR